MDRFHVRIKRRRHIQEPQVMEEESEEEEEEQDDMDVQGIKKEKNVKQVCLIFFAESLFFIRFLKNYQRFCKNLNILMKNISSTKNR